MQAKVELQVLDEPVRPVDATGLTAQTGLIAHTTGNTNSAMKVDSSLKLNTKTERVHIISYLKILGYLANNAQKHFSR